MVNLLALLERAHREKRELRRKLAGQASQDEPRGKTLLEVFEAHGLLDDDED